MEFTTILSPLRAVGAAQDQREHGDSLGRALARLFGCWHRNLSRPFTRDRDTYVVCLRCGMQRNFDLQTWSAHGPFYAEAPRFQKETQRRAVTTSANVANFPNKRTIT